MVASFDYMVVPIDGGVRIDLVELPDIGHERRNR